MREIRERAARGLAPFAKRFRRNKERRHQGAADEQHAHDERGGAQQLPGVPNAAGRLFRRIAGVALHERHHRDAGFESRQAERELRKEQERDEQHRHRIGVLGKKRVRPARQILGMCEQLAEADRQDDDVQRQIDAPRSPRRGQSPRGIPSGRPRRAPSAARS